MFLKKQTPPPVIEYSAALDKSREICPVFIDLSVLKNILSIERCEINTPNEHTKVFIDPDRDGVDDYPFDISRKQHSELIEQASKLKEEQ